MQSLVFQILRAVNYLHSANILHRDLKPSNILVDSNCHLKVCDLGLARGWDESSHGKTAYVTTRWYRAPEIILGDANYGSAIDIWSVGCIFAEILGGTPLFPGGNPSDQFSWIIKILGTPSESDIAPYSKDLKDFIQRLLPCSRVPFYKLFPRANPLALDLLEKMLRFNPQKRPTAKECINHKYFDTIRIGKEKENDLVFDNYIEELVPTIENMRKMIYQECISLSSDAKT